MLRCDRKKFMLSSRAIWFSYLYYFICFFDITFRPHRKPVYLCCTSITYPYWPFPSFLPIAKSDFLNSRGPEGFYLTFSTESVRFMPFLGRGGSMTSAALASKTGAEVFSTALKVLRVGGTPLGESRKVLGV